MWQSGLQIELKNAIYVNDPARGMAIKKSIKLGRS
jgi:hypothetical protein